MGKLPHIIEFKTSIGIIIKQIVTEETVIKLKELKQVSLCNCQEFEIGVIKLLMLDTYRE
jgi:hypothetical protein